MKYYHASTVVRSSHNKIGALKSESGEWQRVFALKLRKPLDIFYGEGMIIIEVIILLSVKRL